MNNDLLPVPSIIGPTDKPKLYLVQDEKERRLIFAHLETIEFLRSEGVTVYDSTIVANMEKDTIDPNNPPAPLVYLIEFHTKSGIVVDALSLGNFSNIYGKPKAGKGWTVAFLISIILGAVKQSGYIRKKNLTDRYRELPPKPLGLCDYVNVVREKEAARPKIKTPIPKKTSVLLIDTEQSDSDVWSEMQRAVAAAGDNPEFKLEALSLRTRTAKERLEEIKIKLYRRTDFAFIVLDGGVDLINDPNDYEESKQILMDELVPLITKLDIHLINVLHENKNNDELRGMFGLIAQQKGELSLHVVKDPDNEYQSIISAGKSTNRRRPFDPFTISYRNDIPELTDGASEKQNGWQGKTAKEKRTWLTNPENGELEQKAEIARAVFKDSGGKEMLIGEIKNKLTKVLDNSSRNFTDKDVAKWFEYFLLTKNWYLPANSKKAKYAAYRLAEFPEGKSELSFL